MSYAPGQVPRDVRDISSFLYTELRKVRNALTSTEGKAAYQTVISVSSAYTLTDSDYFVLVDTTSGSVTVTLPSADDGRTVAIKKLVAANTVTIATPGSETIDGAATQAITAQYGNHVMIAQGGNWFIL